MARYRFIKSANWVLTVVVLGVARDTLKLLLTCKPKNCRKAIFTNSVNGDKIS